MSEIIVQSNFEPSLQHQLRGDIATWDKELTSLLKTLPGERVIIFDNVNLSAGEVTCGEALNLHTIRLGYDPTFAATPEELKAKLQASYFHESYHLARGFSFETTPSDQSALTNAIEEGAATKFEIIRAGSNPGYAQYEDRPTMLKWLKEVQSLPDGFDYNWKRWKFFDPETGRTWVTYKVGVFIVDEALKHNPELSIEDFSILSTDKILELSNL